MKECTKCRHCYDDECTLCPLDDKPLMPSLTGNVIISGRYILEKRLGKGGMGIVFKAKHKFLKSSHAIKVILPNLVEEDDTLLVRFKQEAVLAASIDHPNVIRVTDFGVEDETMPYLVMEFVDGDPLSSFLEPDKPLSVEKMLEFFKPIALGVAEAHRKGIVHRDLKPQNIIVQKGLPLRKAVKVLDFGLAKIKSVESFGSLIQAQTMSILGSPPYMSPEQWENSQVDHRADIYGLGVIVFQMLAGNLPFHGDSIPQVMYQHLATPPPSFASFGVSLPLEIEAAVHRALQKKSEERPNSVEEMLDDLEKAIAKSESSKLTGDETRYLPPESEPGEPVTIAGDQTSPLSESQRDRLYSYFDSSEKPNFLADTQLAQEFLQAQDRVEEAKVKANEADQLVQELAEAQRFAEEAQAKALQAKKRVEDDVRRRVQAEMEHKLAAEQQARQKAEAEAQRLAQEAEARKKAEERANQLAQAALEAQKLAEQERQNREKEARQRELEEGVRREAEIAARELAAQVADAKKKYEEAKKEAANEAELRIFADMKRQKIENELQAVAKDEVERRKLVEIEAQKRIRDQASRFEQEALVAEQRVEQARRLADLEAQKREQAEAAQMRAEGEARRLADEIVEAQRRFEEYRQHITSESPKPDSNSFAPRSFASDVTTDGLSFNLSEQTIEMPRIDFTAPPQPGGETQASVLPANLKTLSPNSQGTFEIRAPAQSNENFAHLLTTSSIAKRKSFVPLIVGGVFALFVALFGGGLFIYFVILPKPEIGSATNKSNNVNTPPGQNTNEKPSVSPAKRIESKMVLIQGGSFMMGRSDIPDKMDERWGSQYPAHPVNLNSFYLDKTEISNEEYAEFIKTGHSPPEGWSNGKPPAGKEKNPVTNVSLEDAKAYAGWVSKRDDRQCQVPTEEQWEYAARNGSSHTLFPWGDDWRADAANLATGKISEVGASSAETRTGIEDMLGNVLEWTTSEYALYPEHGVKVTYKNLFVARGSSFAEAPNLVKNASWMLTRRHPSPPDVKTHFLGFRLACAP